MTLDPTQADQDRHDLATALRKLRKASGLSGERLAMRCHMSQSRISRIETGRLLPSVVDVEQILAALGVDQQTRAELLTLARTANTEYQDIRASIRRGLHYRQRELASLEAGSEHIRYFMPTLITGLLQTPEYMRSAMSPPVGAVSGDTSRAISEKVARQEILYNSGKTFDFLLTESAVRWRICEPPIMAVQIERLISLSKLPNIRIAVITLTTAVAEGAYNTFVVYDRRLVTIELFTGRLVLREPKEIDHYLDIFDHFGSRALHGGSARDYLQSVADGFRNGQ